MFVIAKLTRPTTRATSLSVRCMTIIVCLLVSLLTDSAYSGDLDVPGWGHGTCLSNHQNPDRRRILGKFIDPSLFTVFGHHPAGFSLDFVNTNLPDILDSYEYHIVDKKVGPFQGVMFHGCCSAKKNAAGDSGIKSMAQALKLPVYGYRTVVAFQELRDPYSPDVPFNDGRTVSGHLHINSKTISALRLVDRSPITVLAPPDPNWLVVANPDGGYRTVKDPFEIFSRAKVLSVGHNKGLTRWINSNPNAADPLEKLAGSHSQLKPDIDEPPIPVISPVYDDLDTASDAGAILRRHLDHAMSAKTKLGPSNYARAFGGALIGTIGAGSVMDFIGIPGGPAVDLYFDNREQIRHILPVLPVGIAATKSSAFAAAPYVRALTPAALAYSAFALARYDLSRWDDLHNEARARMHRRDPYLFGGSTIDCHNVHSRTWYDAVVNKNVR